MWASPPTVGIPNIVRSLKIIVTKQIGFSIWQRGYHDHIIRDEKDYQTRWNYIDNNSARWVNDQYFK